jgi:FixJ family two-component response regulator
MSSLPCHGQQETVFVVGKNLADRKDLSRLLHSVGFEALTFSCTETFLQQIDSSVPGCLLLNVVFPAGNAAEFERLILRDYERPVVVLTNTRDIRLAVQAMKAGAVDFLTKPVNSCDLVKAIRSALERDSSMRFAKAQLSAVIDEFRSFERRLATLTPREREVLRYLLAGGRNKEIAFHLGITEKTIKVHRARVLEKMGVPSLAGLVRAASQRGIGLGLDSPAVSAWPAQARAGSASR